MRPNILYIQKLEKNEVNTFYKLHQENLCVGGGVQGAGPHSPQHGGQLRPVLRLCHPLRGRGLCPQAGHL